jgi:hypothetical protein
VLGLSLYREDGDRKSLRNAGKHEPVNTTSRPRRPAHPSHANVTVRDATDNLGEGGFVRLRQSVKFFLYFPKEGFSGKDSYTIWRPWLTVGGLLVPVRMIKPSKSWAIVASQVTP